MPIKIFISYRRQDTSANAIGIGQYLENEFGRKNVYIDVHMHAGTKYPAVIQNRLAECKVMLVLIGPDWLTSKDELGQFRLQKPDDWVRLEIAQALKQGITVIPVLINGAPLPPREMVPVDVQGILDHQVALVTNNGFRHEMAGLVRDIRSIKTPKPWRLIGAATAAIAFLLAAAILVGNFGLQSLLARARRLMFSPAVEVIAQNDVWKSRPGEWVMYAADRTPVAYFLNPASVIIFQDRVTYTARYPLKSTVTSTDAGLGAYEDDRTVLDCRKSTFGLVERSVFNFAGEIISHFKSNEPNSTDWQTIPDGSILALAKNIVCNEEQRTFLKSKEQLKNTHLSYLANTPNGDGSISYGPTKPSTNPAYPIELLFVTKLNGVHRFADLFPGQNVRGLPFGYRTTVQNLQMDCAGKKLVTPTLGYFDENNNLVNQFVPVSVEPLAVNSGSIFALLFNVACGGGSDAYVAGTYEGTNNAIYAKKGQGEQKITITIQQSGEDLKVSFKSAAGGQGEGSGKLKNSRVASISLTSTAADCPGTYNGSLSFKDDSVSWSYKGQDCGGSMEGHGMAVKVN